MAFGGCPAEGPTHTHYVSGGSLDFSSLSPGQAAATHQAEDYGDVFCLCALMNLTGQDRYGQCVHSFLIIFSLP